MNPREKGRYAAFLRSNELVDELDYAPFSDVLDEIYEDMTKVIGRRVLEEEKACWEQKDCGKYVRKK